MIFVASPEQLSVSTKPGLSKTIQLFSQINVSSVGVKEAMHQTHFSG
jgi:hypothetical protein